MAFPVKKNQKSQPKSKAKAKPPQGKAPQPQQQPPQQQSKPPLRMVPKPGDQQPPPFAEPQGAPAGQSSIPSMSSALPTGVPPSMTTLPTQAAPQLSPGAQEAIKSVQIGATRGGDPSAPRPTIPERIKSQTQQWWLDTDNLAQRANALFEFREANKTLFPARFDWTDPLRGRVPAERKTGVDKRRVNISRIYRDTLQTVALTIPEDLQFDFLPVPQAEPPSDPMVPTTSVLNPVTTTFGKTLSITLRTLLDEAQFLKKFRAWVQDCCTFPAAILKFCFRREFETTYLQQTPPDKDTSDAAARLQGLVQQYASKMFTDTDARFQQMLDLIKSLQQNARLNRWFGIDLTLVPLDSFGVSEDATDIASIYDSRFMFEDVLMTGLDMMSAFPYTGEADEQGVTYGVTADELGGAQPWMQDNKSTDPIGGQSRARTNVRNIPAVKHLKSLTNSTVDPQKQKYLVRQIFCKPERTVYTYCRGLQHCLKKYIPQHTSERWYPYAILAPNRVPTEIYGASDLELKRDIQARMNRKRSDEEKARFLCQPRGVYNTQLTDSKEAIKLQDIMPGQMRGINFGSTSVKIDDVLKWIEFQLKPEAYDTSTDARDLDIMGALPVQALGQTGVANYAAEVETAVQGAAVAVKQRQSIVREEIEGALTAISEILLQELTPEEARLIAGPYAFWPIVYDENEAQQIQDAARNAALQQVAPQVMGMVAQDTMMGMPLDPQNIRQQLEQAAAPIWQGILANKYGATEIPTRESIFRRLKVKVKSTLLSSLDKQSRIQSLTLMAQALLGMTQAAALAQVPFNPRELLKKAAMMVDENQDFDAMFPAISPLQVAAAQVTAQVTAQNEEAAAGDGSADGSGEGEGDGQEAGGGAPAAQGAQAEQGTPEEKSRGATAGGGRPDPAEAASAGL